MWRRNILKLVYGLHAKLSAQGKRDSMFMCGLRFVGKRLIVRLFAPNNLFSLKVDSLSMYIRANTDSPFIYFVQPFEPYTTRLFKQAIKPGATILDIGAQFGYFSLIAGKLVGKKGKVYAFEPVPSNFELLVRNIQMNKSSNLIQPIQKAVGEKQGEVKFFVYRDSDSHSMYRHPTAFVRETISVDCVAIDEFLKGRPVDVIKMDVEGHEPYALGGMRKTISKNKNLVLFTEFAPAYLQRAGVEPKDYLKKLQELGFTIRLIDEVSYSLKPITKKVFQRVSPDWRVNLYCIKRKDRL